MMNIFLGCILLGFSMIANANDTLSMIVNPDKGSFVVKLAANPTTGFQWSVIEYDKKLLTLSGSQYQKPQTNLIGAGGQMFFTFTLNKGKSYPDKTNLVFKYARSWEPDTATIKNVTVNFAKTPK
nr:protease inhibitor I42 family protein [Legionella fallonii]